MKTINNPAQHKNLLETFKPALCLNYQDSIFKLEKYKKVIFFMSFGYIQYQVKKRIKMLPRLLFTMITVIFLTYTWHQAGQAQSLHSQYGPEPVTFAQLHETYLDISAVY